MKRDDKAVRYDPFEIEQREWKQRQTKERLKQMLTIASPLFLLLIWEFLSRTGIIDIRFFPPPSAIVGTFFGMIASGEMASHIGVSLYRIFAGFLLGVIPGVVIGLLMGLYSPIRHFVSPIVMALMPIPTLALLPIIIIIFGIGDLSKVVTIAGSVFFPVVINTVAGVINIDSIYLDVAKNYGAGRVRFFHENCFTRCNAGHVRRDPNGAGDCASDNCCSGNDGGYIWNWLSDLDFVQSILTSRNVRRAHSNFIFRLSVLVVAPRNSEEDVTVEVSR